MARKKTFNKQIIVIISIVVLLSMYSLNKFGRHDPIPCADTDGGFAVFTRGNTTGSNLLEKPLTKEDSCYNEPYPNILVDKGNALKEYVCWGDTIREFHIECKLGCSNGKCIDEGNDGISCITDTDCNNYDACSINYCNQETHTCDTNPLLGCRSKLGDLVLCRPDTGVCFYTTDCVSDMDCDDGNSDTLERCEPITASCMFINLNCTVNADCNDYDENTRDFCILNLCQYDTIECNEDGDCDDFNILTRDYCLSNTCHFEEIECFSDDDCDDNRRETRDYCAFNICHNDEIDCVTNSDCDDKDDNTLDLCIGNLCTYTDKHTEITISTCEWYQDEKEGECRFSVSILIIAILLILGIYRLKFYKKRKR